MTNAHRIQKQPRFFSSLLKSNNASLKTEKARLEAFLDAVPGEYCGWNHDGTLAYSEGFCNLLNLREIEKINDIQNSLAPSDAAAIEGVFARLQENGESFSLIVNTADKSRTLRLSGSKGQDLDKEQQFDVLWLEDITIAHGQSLKNEKEKTEFSEQFKRLKVLLDNIQTPVWTIDSNNKISYCNEAYANFINSSTAQVITEQKELSIKPLKTLSEEDISSTIKAHVIAGGKRLLMLVHQTKIIDLDLTLYAAQDITREEELETEQKRHSSANMELLEQLGSAIGIYGSDFKLEFYNSAFSQLWDLEEQWLNSHPKMGEIMEKLRETRRLPEQADFKNFKQSWLDMFTNLIGPHEEMLYLPDDSALRMLAIPHPMGGLMMSFEDVSSRLELESSYNTLIAVQKETLDNLSEGVAVFGGDGRLKLWNPSFAHLWGLHPEILGGEPHITRLAEKMENYFDPEDWPKRKTEIITQCLDRNIHEGRLNRSEGSLIAYSTVPLPDGGVLVTHVDVTDSVRVENALREKNSALEAAERLKLDFLANVSYQLRTPLNAIMGFNEILNQEYFGELGKRQKEYTKGIEEAGESLLNLINDILDLSTIEAGYMELQKDSFSIKKVMDGLYELISDWARKENLEVKFNCPKNIGSLYADERRIKQILLNLLRNAIAYTPKGGTITLSAKKKDNKIEFCIADTGQGIDKKDQIRIFEPFERARKHGMGDGRSGAGLGLTLVKNIVGLHDGELSLQSEAGQGTSVTILIPIEKPFKNKN
jgi:signal transduction histidine kinase